MIFCKYSSTSTGGTPLLVGFTMDAARVNSLHGCMLPPVVDMVVSSVFLHWHCRHHRCHTVNGNWSSHRNNHWHGNVWWAQFFKGQTAGSFWSWSYQGIESGRTAPKLCGCDAHFTGPDHLILVILGLPFVVSFVAESLIFCFPACWLPGCESGVIKSTPLAIHDLVVISRSACRSCCGLWNLHRYLPPNVFVNTDIFGDSPCSSLSHPTPTSTWISYVAFWDSRTSPIHSGTEIGEDGSDYESS